MPRHFFLTWRYSFHKAMIDKKGHNWQRSTSISPGTAVFCAKNSSTTVNLTKPSSLTFAGSGWRPSKATLWAFMLLPTTAPSSGDCHCSHKVDAPPAPLDWLQFWDCFSYELT